MKHVRSAMAGWVVLLVSGISFAQSPADSPLAFAHVDANGDGFVSRSEVPKTLHDLRSHFGQYDKDDDHRLSRGEYSRYLASALSGACKGNMQGERNPNCGGVSAMSANPMRDDAFTPNVSPPPPPKTSGGNPGQ